MARINIFIDKEHYLGASLEEDADIAEALIELGESIKRVQNGETRELKFNDSKRFVAP